MFNLTDVKFIGEPGKDVNLIISSGFIDTSLELTSSYYQL